MSRELPDHHPAGPAGSSSNELSGTVLGPSVQAGTIHGDVHVHAPARDRPPIPRQLPRVPPVFINRHAELALLDQAAGQLDGAATPGLIVLTGAGGVGKTALARWWSHTVRDRFPDGQLYVDLDGFSDDRPAMDPGEALGSFLRVLGVDPGDVPVTLAEQVAGYRTVTARRTLLVVLDNAYSAAQVRYLVPASASSLVVVTSRSRLVGLIPDGARLIEVGPLPTADSVALLSRTIGASRIDREPEPTAQLVELCGGLPIALWVAGARLANRPRLSVGRLAAELADETGRLDRLAVPAGPSVPAAFDVSYRSLDPDAAALYRRLALHPGPEFGTGPVGAALPVTPSPVELLLDANLLEETGEDRFRFHDLIRLHARQKAAATDTEQDRSATVRAIAEWYLFAAQQADLTLTPYRRRLPYHAATLPRDLPDLAGRDLALAWLERERVNLLAAGRAALEHGYAELAWQLADVLWPLFLYGKHYRDRIATDERGVEAARQWGNRWAEADMLKRLSLACRLVGDHPAAERHAGEAIRRYDAEQDTRGSLDAREALAKVYHDSGRLDQAAQLFTELLAANRQLGPERSAGLMMINLGTVLSALGRPEEAIPMLREAAELFDRLADVDPYNQVRALIGLAGAYLDAGALSGAEQVAAAAERRTIEIGSSHEQAEALCLLGRIAQRRGLPEVARSRFRRALEIFEALGSPRAASLRDQLADPRDAAA